MIVHFCFGMAPDFGGRPFGFSHYLAVRSAWEVLEPDAMVMHFAHEPGGEWWELARPMLQLHRVRPVEGIYGYPASHPAHRADIVRLAALIALGGIYLDTDVLVLRPFKSLGDPDFAAAWEFTGDGRLVGLSNAVLMAKAGSRFAQLCLEGHAPKKSLWSGFRANGKDHNYVEMSVRYPAMLASLCPTMVKTLPQETFLWADWSDAGLRKLFLEDIEVPKTALALHLWESHAWGSYLKNLTPDSVRGGGTTFARQAQRFLPDVPSRKVPTAGDGFPKLDFGQMEKICQDVDFVKRPTIQGGVFKKIVQKSSQFVKELQSAVNRSHKGIDCWDGFLSESFLKHCPQEPFTALVISEASSGFAVCEWLSRNTSASGVFSSDSLQNAYGKDGCRSEKFRFIHHDKRDSSSARKISDTLFTGPPDLLVFCEPTNFDLMLKCFGESLPRWVMIFGFSNPSKTAEVLEYRTLHSSKDAKKWLLSQPECKNAGGGKLKSHLRIQSIYGDEVTMGTKHEQLAF